MRNRTRVRLFDSEDITILTVLIAGCSPEVLDLGREIML
jgi:hypothetical protein